MKSIFRKIIKNRKFYMVLPVLVLPFVTLLFWALGGGKGTAALATKNEGAGLILELPDAQFKTDAKDWDKISLYQKAQRDSLKFNEAKKNDPYFRLPPLKDEQDTTKRLGGGTINSSLGRKDRSLDENEQRLGSKIRELQDRINNASANSATPENMKSESRSTVNTQISNDVERLESMMTMMQNGDQEDKEMEEINDVLTKILDIQHPERVKSRLSDSRNLNESVHSTSPVLPAGVITHFANDSNIVRRSDENVRVQVVVNAFYGLNEVVENSIEGNTIEATIYDTQTLIAGSVVKLVLQQEIKVDNVIIPENEFVYGICALNGERLTINISSIRYGNSIFPVSLSVFGLDGLEGIYVPGAIARDAAKQTSDQTLQGLQLSTLDPSLEVQAANAGLEAAKGFLSKKSKMIRVTVKAGHRVLLKDSRSKNN